MRKLYYGYASLRPSCYECLYKSVRHPGDITREYYWEIEKAVPEFDANEGVSLVLVNNEYGEKILNKVKEEVIWKQTKMEDSMQQSFISSFSKSDNRDEFWRDFYNK